MGCEVLSGVGALKVCSTLHNSAPAAPQKQLHLAECTCRKSCTVGCDVLREKLGLGAKTATPPTPLPQPPQNQLQFCNCTRPKICMVGCDVLRGVLYAFQLRCFSTAPQFRFRNSAKSIAVRKSQSQKKLHGGLRGEKRGWRPSLPPHNSASLCSTAKSIAFCRMHLQKKLHVGCDVARGVGA